MEIAYVGGLKVLPYSPDHAGILQYFKGSLIDPNISIPMIEQIREARPRYVIHGVTDSLTQGLAIQIKEEFPDTKQVFWMMDYRPQEMNYDGLWDKWTQSKGCFEHIFLSNKDQLNWWSGAFDCPTSFLSHGCVVQNPRFSHQYRYPAVFIGAKGEGKWWGDRTQLLNEIKELVSFEWLNAGGGDGDAKRIEMWKNMPLIYYSSDVVLDVSQFWQARGYASGRFFYSAGLGGCCVSKRFPDCEELYPQGTKDYFDTTAEAAEKIKFYQKNAKAREQMKMRAWEHNRLYHNYQLRLNEIYAKLNCPAI